MNEYKTPDPMAKVLSVSALAEIAERLKMDGETVVQCHGVFDLMHPGHIRHLQEARQQGAVLVVTLTADTFVGKGPGRPIFNQNLRAETLAALEYVDYVAINDYPTAIEAILQIKPDVFVKGSEYSNSRKDLTGKILGETEAVLSIGGRIHFTEDITFSSSNLINRTLLRFPPETENWLKNFRKSYSAEDILSAFGPLKQLRVLIVGEAIIDEYVFCSGLGKAAKDPILAFLYQSNEAFLGGSLAVANHLGDFCAEVNVVTLVGDTDPRSEFIRGSLHDNATWTPITHIGAPTLRKRRYVDNYTGAKIFELYYMNDDPLPDETEKNLINNLTRLLPDYDVVIVPDYGHGMMTPNVIELVASSSAFLVVNTQANAGNKGFSTVSKYPRADYVCLAGHEMELETRMRHVSHREMLAALERRINCPRYTITLGKSGSLHYQSGGEFLELPAFAPTVVDRVGAGDAVLALTGVLAATHVSWDILGFLGNVAGAEMVSDLGNRTSLSKVNLSKHVTALLK